MQRKSIQLLSLLIILSFIVNTSCKTNKRNKKRANKNSTNNKKIQKIKISDEIRPSDVSRELFCDVCQAIIIEALKNLRNLHKESDILFYLTNGICSQNNFNNYHFSKPEMEIGCEALIGEYSEEIQKILIERNPKVDDEQKIIHKFCFNKIKACNGVDLKNRKPIEYEIINGELYDIEKIEQNYKVHPRIEEINYGEDEIKEKENNSKPEL